MLFLADHTKYLDYMAMVEARCRCFELVLPCVEPYPAQDSFQVLGLNLLEVMVAYE